MRLNIFLAPVVALMFPIGAWSADTKVDARAEAKADAKADDLNGTWSPESAELAGQPLPEEARKAIKLVIKDEKYTVTIREKVDEGTARTDSTAKPKTLDIMGTNGPNKGKTLLAIYELDGDTLKVCYDLSGRNRPKEFKTMPGSSLFLVTYRREKPKDS